MYNDPIVLQRWRVAKVRRRATDTVWVVHAYGYSPREDSGYTTPAILKWNDKTAVITTQGGDRFELSGEPGNSRDASASWQKFLTRYRIESHNILDVSDRYTQKGNRVA